MSAVAEAGERELPAAGAGPGPLTGLRVIEIGDESVDYAGLVLAGLGAEVIKVEPPEGAPGRTFGPFLDDVPGPERSLYFFAYNRGKRSVVLDLVGCPEVDLVRLRELVAGADVLLDGTPRGRLAQLGIDPAADRQLIHARITPFGDDGPWADLRTTDLVSLALGGVTMNCGYDPDPFGHYDEPPIAPQMWHSLHVSGEQLVIGIVGALVYRVRSGHGQTVSVAIHEAVAKNTEIDLMSWVMMRQPVFRQTCRHALPTINNPSITYTKDGRWNLALSVGNRDRRRLRPFMEKFGLAEGLEEVTAADEVGVRAVAGSIASGTANVEFVQRLTRRYPYHLVPWQQAQEAGMLWSPVRKPEENAVDEHWLARGTFTDVDHPELGRTLRYPTSKWLSTRGSWTAGRRAPQLGEDGETVTASHDTPARARARAVGPEAGGEVEALSARGKPLPLAGVRVLDFTWFLASSGATRCLAALGADVLKIEWKTHPDTGRGSLVPQGGREARAGATEPLAPTAEPEVGGQFNNKNAGKRGLSINVAEPRGLEIAKRLLVHCDVVAEGFSPGVLERWGLGYEEQRRIRPDVIYVKQSGMGAFGTYGRFRAAGPIAGALSGLSEMSGLPEPAPPAGWGYSYLDWFGAYSMALSILAAVYHREQTGEGQWIDASQTEVGIGLTAVPVLDWSANGRRWQRYGNRSPYKRMAPQGIYPCAGEDRWLAVSARDDAEWRALAGVIGTAGLAADARLSDVEGRIAHHDELDGLIEAWTRELEPYAAMRALQDAGVAAGVCQTAGDRCDHDPQLRHLGWLTELTGTQIGTWPLAELPIRMSQTPPYLGGRPNRAAPLYGEDNAAVLTELLGMSAEEIAQLTEEGVL